MGTLDLSVLNAWYAAKAGSVSSATTTVAASNAGIAAQLLSGGTVTANASAPTIRTGPTAPTPPWSVSTASASTAGAGAATISAQTSALMRSLAAGGKLINPSAAQLSGVGTDPNATTNYRNLFALYQGLTNLQSIAKAATAKTLTPLQTQQLQQAFTAGMAQVQGYLGGQPFKGFQVYQTAPEASASSGVAIPVQNATYTTQTLFQGDPNSEVPAFQGDGQFSLTATKASGDQVTVDFDLSDLGAQPRTFANVLTYMNGKMADAGLTTRFGESYTPGKATTTTVGTKTVTQPAGPGRYALKIVGSTAETLSFSAPVSDPAVYVAQSSGIAAAKGANAIQQQLVKFDASDAPADPAAVNSQVFDQALGAGVSKAVATASAPDGSVYVLADVTGAVNGQSIQGPQDVALIKYDSAGNVVYTRTLGAQSSASGYGLAVSADGSQVAIVGSTTDNLNPTGSSASQAAGTPAAGAPPQGFVTVYDASGNEQWTQQTAAIGGNGGGVQPSSVAFGAGGTVYVAGQVDGRILGGSSSGGQDAYVQAFHAASTPLNDGSGNSTWTVTPTAVAQYGTSGQDRATGVAVSGSSIYVSSVEGGDAVVRSFTASGGSGTGLTQTAVGDLGSLQGGNVAGIAVNADGSVVVAGSTHNGALDGGSVTQAYSGGEEAFVASLSASLQPGALTYIGGGADQTASALTISNGQVYIAGQIASTPVPGSGETSAFQGYVEAVDPTTGQASWEQTYNGQANEAAPAGIAVTQGGASVLDALGLPGNIDPTPSQQLVANTSLRPGDEFFVQTGTGTPKAVTIAAGDTYKTLALKIAAASNYAIKATVVASTSGNTLKLAPAFPGKPVALSPGPVGRDALSPLGFSQGMLTSAASQESSPSPGSLAGPATSHTAVKNGYSLNLSSSLSLASPARATAANGALSGAIATIKGIYANMTTTPKVGGASASGSVPTYLTNEIANYQAALSRLTGGS
ncbi:MAG TPA: hypothetical protein VIJ94_14285 [Caulobacteraceae bacterium]